MTAAVAANFGLPLFQLVDDSRRTERGEQRDHDHRGDELTAHDDAGIEPVDEVEPGHDTDRHDVAQADDREEQPVIETAAVVHVENAEHAEQHRTETDVAGHDREVRERSAREVPEARTGLAPVFLVVAGGQELDEPRERRRVAVVHRRVGGGPHHDVDAHRDRGDDHRTGCDQHDAQLRTRRAGVRRAPTRPAAMMSASCHDTPTLAPTSTPPMTRYTVRLRRCHHTTDKAVRLTSNAEKA